MYKLEYGNEEKITNWWSVDKIVHYTYEGDFLKYYIENRFECIDSAYRGWGYIIRTSAERKEDEGTERIKEYSYNTEGNLIKISSSASLSLIKDFVWEGKRLKSIQSGKYLYDFSYATTQWNNLNIDLFYFILYGLCGWDEDVCLLQLTGLRSIHLPNLIKYRNETWNLSYERDTEGYIVYIFLDKKGGKSYKWKIHYH